MKTSKPHWVPSVYLMQGLPFALVNAVSPVLYKSVGISNSEIAFYTSLFIFPWIFKFFLAPALERLASKRSFTLMTQLAIALFIFLLAVNLHFWNAFYFNNMIFIFIAFAAAIHDINADGLYLESLDYQTQARLIGIRTVFYQTGRLICQGCLVMIIGWLSWSSAMSFLSLFVFFIFLYNKKVIPVHIEEKKLGFQKIWETTKNSYRDVLKTFGQLPCITSAVIFIVFYNFPEAQLNKIIPLFILDKIEQGGLGLNIDTVGFIQGVLSISAMLIGVTLSGWMLERFTLKKCLLPFTFLLMLANASFLMLSLQWTSSLVWISLCVIVTQFFYGLCNGAYMFYLLKLFSGYPYSMSLYAIGTALMLLGIMLAGACSGFLQAALGYTYFFAWVVVLNFFVLLLSHKTSC